MKRKIFSDTISQEFCIPLCLYIKTKEDLWVGIQEFE